MSRLLQATKTLVSFLFLGLVTLSDVMVAEGVLCLTGQMRVKDSKACVDCPENTYNDIIEHSLTECKRCPQPGENQEVLEKCTKYTPGKLVCKENYFWNKKTEECSLCSECDKGSIVRNCSKEEDTDCCNTPGYMVVSIDGKNQCQYQGGVDSNGNSASKETSSGYSASRKKSNGNGASKETSNGNRASRKMSNANGASTTNMSCSLFIICAVLVMLHVCLTSDDGLFVR